MDDDEQDESLFAVGIVINIFGNVTINAGANMINHANQSSKEVEAGSLRCWRPQNIKRIGWVLFVLGNCLSFVSFAFAAQTLLSGFGSIQFVTNVIFVWFRGVRPTLRQVVGTICIIAGNMLVVQAANKETHRYTSSQLKTFFWTTSYLVYTGITCVLSLILQWLHNQMLKRRHVSKILREEGEYKRQHSLFRPSFVSSHTSNSRSLRRSRSLSDSNTNHNTNSNDRHSKHNTARLAGEAIAEKNTPLFAQSHQQSPTKRQEPMACFPIPSPQNIPTTLSHSFGIREGEANDSFEIFFPLPRPVREKSIERGNTFAPTCLTVEEVLAEKLKLPKDAHPTRYNPHIRSYGVRWKKMDGPMALHPIKSGKPLLRETQSDDRLLYISHPVKNVGPKRSFDAITSGDVKTSERKKNRSLTDPETVIPLLYTMSSALVGTQSAVYAKCLSSMVVLSTTGKSQVANWFTWVVLILWSFFMVFWLIRMNTALRRFDGGFIIPLLQVLWIIGCISCGGIFFQEFWGFNWKKWLLFSDGIICVCIGVYLLGNSMAPESSSPDTNEAKSKPSFSHHNSLSRKSLIHAVSSSVRRISLGSPPILSLDNPSSTRKLPPTETSPLTKGNQCGAIYT